jgi:hypothetical protein
MAAPWPYGDRLRRETQVPRHVHTHLPGMMRHEDREHPHGLDLWCWVEENRVWQVEIEAGFSLEDLLVELGTLER